MSKAFLHSTLRKQLNLSLSPDEVAMRLQILGAEVDTTNFDQMPFKLEHDDISIEGMVERWQGTESRLRFVGELSLPPYDMTNRTRISFFLGVVIVLISVAYIPQWTIAYFGAEGGMFYMNSHLAIAFITGLILALIVGRFINVDPYAKRRWEAQQVLGRFAEILEKW